MKIALISDIHANCVALDAVLARIRQDGIKTIVCLGDVAMFGPQPARVIQRMRELKIPTVMGNTDPWSVKLPMMPTSDERTRILGEISAWCFSQLAPADRDLISTFQNRIELVLDDNNRLLCYHGSPRSITENLLATTSDEDLKAMMAGSPASVFAGGHTHKAMLRQMDNLYFVNPGSVGRPTHPINAKNTRWPYAEYAVINFEDGLPNFSFYRVPYNQDDLSSAVRLSNMPHGQWWLDH